MLYFWTEQKYRNAYKEDAIDYGVTGPNLRASGVQFDIRKNDTYSIYSKFDFEIPVRDTRRLLG